MYERLKRNARIDEFLDYWQKKKKQRIGFIMRFLESKKEVDMNQFLGLMTSEYGIRRQTAKEYLRDLQDYGVIEFVDDKIRWVGKKEEGEGHEG